jgi:dihydroorotase
MRSTDMGAAVPNTNAGNPAYDLVLMNGEVIDPVSDLRDRLDIAIQAGRIEGIERHAERRIDPQSARRVLDVAGMLVVPGLIDMHTHVYWGITTDRVSDLNAPPDLVGVQAGITTVVDAGSAGYYDWGGFARYVASVARTRVLALLSIYRTSSLQSLVTGDRPLIDVQTTIRTVEANRSLIRGIKLLLSGPSIDALGMEAVRLAVRAARETGTRLMVHVGDLDKPPSPRAPSLTREMLGMLAQGDILTHLCTANPGGILDEKGHALPELLAARERGVVLDSAQGRYNFSFDVARRLMDQGVVPDAISSDLTLGGRTWRVYSLTECMSKFLALGMGVEDVIRRTTCNPARALGMSDTLGRIEVGREADLSILQQVDGKWEFTDSLGQKLRGKTALVPVAAIRSGQVIMPDWGPHPWGWLPAQYTT